MIKKEITESQKERLIDGLNNLKDINNDIQDACPLDYAKVIELIGLEYVIAGIFNLELPTCEHSYDNRYRSYVFKETTDEK